MENPLAYIPMDRRHALVRGQTLPNRDRGAALFADISGFTPLTEALVRELGPQRGAEELTRYLNLVYDAVIDELHRYGGSVIAFAGDAITCWLTGDNGLRATAAALAMQKAMEQFGAICTPAGSTVTLAMKAAVATGSARRFLVGDPASRVIDALAGETLVRLAAAEHLAEKGEVVIDGAALPTLAAHLQLGAQRQDERSGQNVAVVTGLRQPVDTAPWPLLPADALSDEQVRNWLLPAVYERLQRGMGNFLAELRPTVALFLRFGGIDYDHDEAAGLKLDTYIRWVQGIVNRYEGTLIDLNIGDKGSYLYINFGAPLAHEDNAERAAAAALLLRDQPERLTYIGLVQIGISQGRMRAGAYGGANHRTYGVLGDEVNMAARLMMAAEPGQILVSPEARRSIGAGFVLEELPPIRVKGKSQPTVVFALQGTRQSYEFQLAAHLYALPMVGRQEQLALIAQKIEKARQGQGQLVGVSGEAGLGKSRLVAEAIRLAGEQQFAIYSGECESYGVNSSYLVWQSIWRSLLGVDASWSLNRQIAALESKLNAIDPALLPRLPLLGALLNIELLDNELTFSFDAKLRKTSLESLLVDCLRAEARRRPLLLLLEDCQWLDALSYDLLEVLSNAIVDLPVLLVYAWRPLESERLRQATLHNLSHHTEVALPALDREEATQLVQLKLSQLASTDAPFSATLLQRIVAQAEGNPFYIEELITYLHHQGVNLHDGSALATVELPDSLQRLVLSHVDQLGETPKITLKVASVIGRVFQAAWLAGAYPELGDPERIRADLETLHQQDLMRPEPGAPELTYLFKQVITQDVTYESLPYALRTLLHEQIGGFIESAYPTALEQYLDLLAYHYDRSENREKRRHYLLQAAESAQANYANAAAIDYYQRVLPLLQDAEQGAVTLKLGQVLELVGEWKEADQHYRQALVFAEANGDAKTQTGAQIAIGELARKQGRYDEATTWYTLAQRNAEQHSDPAGVAKALICAGTLADQQGDFVKSRSLYEQSLAIRRALNDLPNIANLLNNMAISAANQGDFAQAQALFAESLAIRRSLENKWAVATSLNNLGELALLQQAYNEARTYLEEAVTSHRLIGDKWMLGNALVTLGNVVRAQENYSAAYALYRESLQIYRELGDRRMLAYLLENIGALSSLRGEGVRALRLAGAAATLRTVLGTPLSLAEQQQLDDALAPAHQTLAPAVATAAWQAGQALSLEAAIAEALSL